MTPTDDLKAWRKKRKAARRAVIRAAMAFFKCEKTSGVLALDAACQALQDLEELAPEGEPEE